MLQELTYPILTMAERDRRHALARAFMDEHDLDVLILGPSGSRIFHYWQQSQQYLSNCADGTYPLVVFPRESDPVLLAIRTEWGLIRNEQLQGFDPWIADYRLHEGGTNIVSVLKEKNLTKGRAGVIAPGAEGGMFGSKVGALVDPMWTWISEETDLEGVDIGVAFSIATLPKSEEELRLARHAAHASDKAATALVQAAGTGVTEFELYRAAVDQYAAAGVDLQNFMTVVDGGYGSHGMGLPRWLTPNRPARTLQLGDVVIVETFPTYAGIDTQLELSVHVGEPSDSQLRAFNACLSAHRAGTAALKPGVTFLSVKQAMEEAVFEAGCWNWDPMLHSLSPMLLVGDMHYELDKHEGLDQELRLSRWPAMQPPWVETEIKEGMLFQFEPGAAFGNDRSITGCVMQVTADGCKELTSVGTQLHVVE